MTFSSRIAIPYRVLTALAGMLILSYVVYHFNIPNPNMILVAGLVVYSSLLGIYSGATAAVVMIGYSVFFFSENHDWVTFTDIGRQKVIVAAFSVIVITAFVCYLKYCRDAAFNQSENYAKLLKRDNELLEEASKSDALTGLHNRLALRRDYDAYTGKKAHVLMIDLDGFKGVNDSFGHETGDDVLSETGRIIRELFGRTSTYRYGGDEFLIIDTNMDETKFRSTCDLLSRRISDISSQLNMDAQVNLSGGYVHGTLQDNNDLREMIREADKLLYESKNEGKDQIRGESFSGTEQFGN